MNGIIRVLSDAIYYNLIREQRYLLFVNGLGVSLRVTLYSAILGTLIGLLLAFAKLGRFKALRKAATLYVDIIRGTPAVVQLVLIYYAILWGQQSSKDIDSLHSLRYK